MLKVRKTFAIALIALLLFLPGCGGNTGGEKYDETVIVTSFYPVYVSTINITRCIEGVKVINMAESAAGCLHDYALTTENIRLLETADCFVINGAGNEEFLDRVIEQLPDLEIIDASEGFELIESEDEINPHVWVSPAGAKHQARTIAEKLAAFDKANADKYRANGADYAGRLDMLIKRMDDALKPYAGENIVTFHDAFAYFAREFGLVIGANIAGEHGEEPSAAELADIVKLIREKNIRGLFAEPQYSSAAADAIARETGLEVRVLDPAVTGDITADDYDAYIRVMDKNTQVLLDAFK